MIRWGSVLNVITIQGEADSTREVKVLGVTLDQCLSWKPQIDVVAMKLTVSVVCIISNDARSIFDPPHNKQIAYNELPMFDLITTSLSFHNRENFSTNFSKGVNKEFGEENKVWQREIVETTDKINISDFFKTEVTLKSSQNIHFGFGDLTSIENSSNHIIKQNTPTVCEESNSLLKNFVKYSVDKECHENLERYTNTMAVFESNQYIMEKTTKDFLKNNISDDIIHKLQNKYDTVSNFSPHNMSGLEQMRSQNISDSFLKDSDAILKREKRLIPNRKSLKYITPSNEKNFKDLINKILQNEMRDNIRKNIHRRMVPLDGNAKEPGYFDFEECGAEHPKAPGISDHHYNGKKSQLYVVLLTTISPYSKKVNSMNIKHKDYFRNSEVNPILCRVISVNNHEPCTFLTTPIPSSNEYTMGNEKSLRLKNGENNFNLFEGKTILQPTSAIFKIPFSKAEIGIRNHFNLFPKNNANVTAKEDFAKIKQGNYIEHINVYQTTSPYQHLYSSKNIHWTTPYQTKSKLILQKRGKTQQTTINPLSQYLVLNYINHNSYDKRKRPYFSAVRPYKDAEVPAIKYKSGLQSDVDKIMKVLLDNESWTTKEMEEENNDQGILYNRVTMPGDSLEPTESSYLHTQLPMFSVLDQCEMNAHPTSVQNQWKVILLRESKNVGTKDFLKRRSSYTEIPSVNKQNDMSGNRLNHFMNMAPKDLCAHFNKAKINETGKGNELCDNSHKFLPGLRLPNVTKKYYGNIPVNYSPRKEFLMDPAQENLGKETFEKYEFHSTDASRLNFTSYQKFNKPSKRPLLSIIEELEDALEDAQLDYENQFYYHKNRNNNIKQGDELEKTTVACQTKSERKIGDQNSGIYTTKNRLSDEENTYLKNLNYNPAADDQLPEDGSATECEEEFDSVPQVLYIAKEIPKTECNPNDLKEFILAPVPRNALECVAGIKYKNFGLLKKVKEYDSRTNAKLSIRSKNELFDDASHESPERTEKLLKEESFTEAKTCIIPLILDQLIDKKQGAEVETKINAQNMEEGGDLFNSGNLNLSNMEKSAIHKTLFNEAQHRDKRMTGTNKSFKNIKPALPQVINKMYVHPRRNVDTNTSEPQDEYSSKFQALQADLQELQNSILSQMKSSHKDDDKNLTLQIRVIVDVINGSSHLDTEKDGLHVKRHTKSIQEIADETYQELKNIMPMILEHDSPIEEDTRGNGEKRSKGDLVNNELKNEVKNVKLHERILKNMRMKRNSIPWPDNCIVNNARMKRQPTNHHSLFDERLLQGPLDDSKIILMKPTEKMKYSSIHDRKLYVVHRRDQDHLLNTYDEAEHTPILVGRYCRPPISESYNIVTSNHQNKMYAKLSNYTSKIIKPNNKKSGVKLKPKIENNVKGQINPKTRVEVIDEIVKIISETLFEPKTKRITKSARKLSKKRKTHNEKKKLIEWHDLKRKNFSEKYEEFGNSSPKAFKYYNILEENPEKIFTSPLIATISPFTRNFGNKESDLFKMFSELAKIRHSIMERNYSETKKRKGEYVLSYPLETSTSENVTGTCNVNSISNTPTTISIAITSKWQDLSPEEASSSQKHGVSVSQEPRGIGSHSTDSGGIRSSRRSRGYHCHHHYKNHTLIAEHHYNPGNTTKKRQSSTNKTERTEMPTVSDTEKVNEILPEQTVNICTCKIKPTKKFTTKKYNTKKSTTKKGNKTVTEQAVTDTQNKCSSEMMTSKNNNINNKTKNKSKNTSNKSYLNINSEMFKNSKVPYLKNILVSYGSKIKNMVDKDIEILSKALTNYGLPNLKDNTSFAFNENLGE